MKTSKSGWFFLGGAAFGMALVLCLGAAEKAGNDFSRLQMFSYPSGGTGIFDPSTGRIYVYDANLDRVSFVREITILGQQMRWR